MMVFHHAREGKAEIAMTEENKPWFGPKRIGFGISPKSWQGWLTIFVYIAVVLATLRLLRTPHPAATTVVLVIATIALIVIMIAKGSTRRRS
jgi:hypothetical protein